MKLICILLALFVWLTMPVFAQTATLRGQVTDESGAIIPGATVKVIGPNGLIKTVTTGSDGSYSFAGLMPGNYTVLASAPDLAMAKPAKVTNVRTGKSLGQGTTFTDTLLPYEANIYRVE